MKKSKYEKPVVRNLDAVQPVLGSCGSGNVEYTLTLCEPGGIAFKSCNVGDINMPFVPCENGSSAGGGCVNGYEAG